MQIKKKQGRHDSYIYKNFSVVLHSCYTKVAIVKNYSYGSITHATHVTGYF